MNRLLSLLIAAVLSLLLLVMPSAVLADALPEPTGHVASSVGEEVKAGVDDSGEEAEEEGEEELEEDEEGEEGEEQAEGSFGQGSSSAKHHKHVVACVVPAISRESLAVARAALLKAHCNLGKVFAPHGHHSSLRVVWQSSPRGTRLTRGSAIAVKLASKAHHR